MLMLILTEMGSGWVLSSWLDWLVSTVPVLCLYSYTLHLRLALLLLI
jgi:hypothetical protein